MRNWRMNIIVVLVDTIQTNTDIPETPAAAVEPTPRSAVWARTFAVVYDPFLWAGERAGLRKRRQALLDRAVGRTVEIGAGTGLNIRHYPDHLEALVLAEPDDSMRSRLTTRVARHRGHAAGPGRLEVLDAPAERLPLPDGSVDTVVSTFVLCTVDAPDLAVQEIARVLKPGGQLLFIEHVRSESPALARWQDRLARPWQAFGGGCRCNRATAELIAACGLELDQVDHGQWRAMPPIVRPLIAGRARKSTGHETSGAAAVDSFTDGSH